MPRNSNPQLASLSQLLDAMCSAEVPPSFQLLAALGPAIQGSGLGRWLSLDPDARMVGSCLRELFRSLAMAADPHLDPEAQQRAKEHAQGLRQVWLQAGWQSARDDLRVLRKVAARIIGHGYHAADDPSAKPLTVAMTWPDAANRLKRLRDQGEPWTSQREFADRFGCSSCTINKAIKKTPELHAWAKRPTAAGTRLQAQSLNEFISDNKAQHREPNPGDDAAEREFLENAEPDVKAWYLAQSREDQLEFLNDQDKGQKIYWRKP
jgi:hypothetical protein